jgi:hypothetical protein
MVTNLFRAAFAFRLVYLSVESTACRQREWTSVRACRGISAYTAHMHILERNDAEILKRCDRCDGSRYNDRKDYGGAFEMFLREMAEQNHKIACPICGKPYERE